MKLQSENMRFLRLDINTNQPTENRGLHHHAHRVLLVLSLLSFISLSIVVPVLEQDLRVLTEVLESDSEEKDTKTSQVEKKDVKTIQVSLSELWLDLTSCKRQYVSGDEHYLDSESEPGTPPPEPHV